MPTVLVAEVNVTPASDGSASVAPMATDGPALRTTICQRTEPPATGVPEISDFDTDRSALVTTSAVAVAVADVGLGSMANEVAVAVLVIVVPAACRPAVRP